MENYREGHPGRQESSGRFGWRVGDPRTSGVGIRLAVRMVDPVTEPLVALMVEVPLAATVVARPPELMVATPVLDD